MLHLNKRDRYARRPDKAWRSKWLREVTRSFTLFDIENRFWYNNITPTNEETKDEVYTRTNRSSR